MAIVGRFFSPPRSSFFLLGPRGTGKSTWIKHLYPDALSIDLLQPETFRAYSAREERLRETIEARPGATRILIDEIQRIPSLLTLVHAMIEENPRLRFVLTGSSARKIRRQGVDLLAGRALLQSLHPFMAAELGKAFTLEGALRFGLLPVVTRSPEPEAVLRSYVSLYIQEEVRSEAIVRDIGSFSRFLEVAALSHATVVNLSNWARESEISRKTAEGYVSVLEDLLLSFRVPVFERRAKRALASHPKFYLFDAGVFRSLRPMGPLDSPEGADGAALEGLVAQHLRAWNAYRGEKNRLFYWRTRSGVEVDLVLYGPDGLWAFEVKNAKRVRPEDIRVLRSFGTDYPQARLVLLYRGKERLRVEGVSCIPCSEFLLGLHPGRALSPA